jgi:proteasome lid subunit RPN8/RPN11
MHYTLRIPCDFYDAMITQAIAALPDECCGLLAGCLDLPVAEVTKVLPLANDALEPARNYHSEPRSMFAAYKAMQRHGLELLAIYHSHPTADASPSRKDVQENSYGESVMHLIISLKDGPPHIKGWWLGESKVEPGHWEKIDNVTSE